MMSARNPQQQAASLDAAFVVSIVTVMSSNHQGCMHV
jgi:hypothetical protein